MDSRTQERVERWDSRPFTGGYDELGTLADDEFSGAVAAGGAWLFMLNGRVVGVVDGDIDAFGDASGTIYDAPHPSLPLLSSMEERGGETRAKYYTQETPLEDVDETLRQGSFTGYVELSEKVLSGDYYVVYYGGRRMAAAYIGNAERLVTGDEAFERAADEVGIYEVTDVDVEVIDVPGHGSPSTEADSSDDSAPSEPGTDSSGPNDETPPGGGSVADASGVSSTGTSDAGDPGSASEVDRAGGTDRAAESESVAAGDDLEDGSIVTEAEPNADPGGTDGERTGITSTDGTSRDPPSPGITDESAGTDEVDSSTGSETDSGTRAPRSDDARPESSAGTRSEPSADDASPIEDASGGSVESESGTGSVDAGESTPTPEEIEAAAEELAGDDVPWTESAAEGTAIDDAAPRTDASPRDGNADRRPETDDSEGAREERFKQEEQWRETTSIPSLDPDHTTSSGTSGAESGSSRGTPDSGRGPGRAPESGSDAARSRSDATETRTDATESRSDSSARGRGDRRAESRPEQGRKPTERDAGADRSGGSDRDSSSGDEPLRSDMLEREDRIDQLTQRVDELERRRDALESTVEELEGERDRLQSENEDLTATVERLRARIDELETELETARSTGAAGGSEAASASGAGTELSPARALSGTNLFVRYDSKSQPTLETAHDGDADRSDVATNLRLEHHTQFDESDVTVDGRPFEEFLVSTMEYQFVDWLVKTLLYEIRDTGRHDGLSDLYDAIPRIDRAELHATVSLADDDTEDVPDEVTFDVVAFDKRGNPLVVAALNDSRDPATQEMLETMEEEASAVAANYPELGAAFVVTSSFFEPGALEVTERATSGGFLSRSGNLSYVNLSRKQGYHLSLVESRSGGFHVNVPEL